MINTLLIDDEPAANRSLRSMLERKHQDLRIIGEAMSLRGGLQQVVDKQPELIFLDINLPDGLGFDLVRQLPAEQRPEIIFVTSEENYTMQAIRVAALGYLLKPVDPDELSTSIELAKVRIRQRNSERRLEALLSNLDQPDAATQQISIPSERGVDFVQAGDILYCEGEGGYTRIVMRDGQHLSSYSIGEYRKMLDPHGFYAVHRSYLVNRLHVAGWADATTLKLKNGARIDVSRRRKNSVKAWLEQASVVRS